MGEPTILISGGTIVDAAGSYRADLLVQGEKIRAIGQLASVGVADTTLDATGRFLLPGLIDPHVHFEKDEFMGTRVVHDFDTGTMAGIYGGVTTVIDFYNQKRGEDLLSSYARKSAEAEGKAYVDWSFHATITDPTPETLQRIPELIEKGIPTFKCYTTYREDGLMVEDLDLLRILEISGENGGMILVHTEDDALSRFTASKSIHAGRLSLSEYPRARPRIVENESIRKISQLAGFVNAPVYVVHMSTQEGVDIISQARAEGAPVWGETCTQYLVLNETFLQRKDAIKYFCNPPLRTSDDQDVLWKALTDGRLSVVSTDDSAFTFEAKLMGKDRFDKVPAGLPGIETRLPLLYSEGVAQGRISTSDMVAVSSTNVAKLFGLFPQKGQLSPGSDADIVIFNPDERWTMGANTLHMVPRWSPFEGWEIQGRVETVISRGEIVLDGGELSASPGRGRMVRRELR